VAAIAAFWFFVIAAANGQFLVAGLAVALAGCALGFLRHNFHPARIYMGDAGALFLGFMLAAIGVKLRFDGPTEVTFFVPVLVLGVAIFDTTLVTVARLIHGRSPVVGGRDHVSHRLVFVGVPVPAAVGLLYAAAVGLGWLGLVMSRVDTATGFLLMALVLTGAAFLGGLLGVVPVYETSRRRRVMIHEVARHDADLTPNGDGANEIVDLTLQKGTESSLPERSIG
jgi:UDP-GlcNAc:undecaprenyl-phosphate GlcNAc-1-phosphate transferase